MSTQSPTLRLIITEAAAGMTFEQLSDRSVDPTTGRRGVSAAHLNRLANGKVDRMPTEDHLRAIATVLRLPYEQVRRAAIAEWLPGTDPEVPADINLREWASWSQDDRDLVQLAVRSANARARQRERDKRKPGNAA